MRSLLASLLLLAPVALAQQPPAPAIRGDNITVQGTGVPAGRSATLPQITAQEGILLDTFREAADVDDTASLTRAVTAGVPILLGPRVYEVRDFSTGNISSFVMRGIPGVSTIRRTGATGGTFFGVAAAFVHIEGVIFDMNKATVSANQWGVFVSRTGGGQNVTVRDNVFKDNSGTLGICFGLVNTSGTGVSAGGSFTFENNEVSGCTFNSAYFASVSNGRIVGNRIHDNTGTHALYISGWSTASAVNHSAHIVVEGNRVWNNEGSGISLGGISVPYDFVNNHWGARRIRVANNFVWDNASANITVQGQAIEVIGNTLRQINAPEITFGILCNADGVVIADNRMEHTSVDYTIDCGGALDPIVINNYIRASRGSTINLGGTRNAVIRGNTVYVDGTAFAGITYATEGAGGVTGENNGFPTVHTGMIIENNAFHMSGANSRGLAFFDNAGGFTGARGTIVRNNEFYFTDGASSTFGLTWFGTPRSIQIYNNRIAGNSRCFSDLTHNNGPADLVVNDLCEEIQTNSANLLVPVRAITNPNIQAYNSGGSILYIYPTAGGTGYSSASTLTVTCSGTNPINVDARPVLQGGAIVGVRVSNIGSGCVGTPAVSASGGTGATFVVSNTPTLPAHRRLRVQVGSNTMVMRGGGAIGIAGPGGVFFLTNSSLDIDSGYSGTPWFLVAPPVSGSFSGTAGASTTGSISGTTLTVASGTGISAGQYVTGTGVAAYTAIVSGSGTTWTVNISQTVASTAITTNPLPTCNSLTNATEITVVGGTGNRWRARCNGTSWFYADGTAAP